MVTLSWLRFGLAGGRLAIEGPRLPSFERVPLLFVFGVFAAVAGWHYLKVVGDAREGDLDRLWPTALLLHLVASAALPFTSNDLFSSVTYGRMVWHGINPYVHGPSRLGLQDSFTALVDPRWRSSPTDYGPLATALGALAGASPSVVGALVIYKLALLACSLGAMLLARHMCVTQGIAGARSFAAIAWNPLLIWEISGQAHSDGLMLIAMMLFLALAQAKRSWSALAALAAAFYTKFAVAPILGLYLVVHWHGVRRKALAMAISVAGLGAALFVPFWSGRATVQGILLAATGGSQRTSRSIIDAAMLLADLLGRPRHGPFLMLASIGAIVLVAFAARAVYRTHSLLDVYREGLFFLLVWTVTTACYQAWYATWLLPLAAVIDDITWQRFVALFSVVQLAQYGIPLDSSTNVAIDAWAITRMIRMRGRRNATE